MDFKTILEKGIWMSMEEAQLLERTAREINPKRILEIGGAVGASSMILGHIVKDTGGHLYTIEQNPQPKWYENMKYFGLDKNATLIKGYSPWIPYQNYVISQGINYLFIDGNHDTRWVLADYHHWSIFVRKGGRIAFHDWNNQHKKEQVRQAVKIILNPNTEGLKEIGRVDSTFGLIVFEKKKEKFDFKPI